jgi:hypothetical protein
LRPCDPLRTGYSQFEPVGSLKELFCAATLLPRSAARSSKKRPRRESQYAPGPSLGNVAVSRRTATFNHHLITFGIAPLFYFAHLKWGTAISVSTRCVRSSFKTLPGHLSLIVRMHPRKRINLTLSGELDHAHRRRVPRRPARRHLNEAASFQMGVLRGGARLQGNTGPGLASAALYLRWFLRFSSGVFTPSEA